MQFARAHLSNRPRDRAGVSPSSALAGVLEGRNRRAGRHRDVRRQQDAGAARRSPVDLTYRFRRRARRDDRRRLPRVRPRRGRRTARRSRGTTITIRSPRRRNGSPARRSSTRARCSCRSLPYLGEATVEVGLYQGNERLPLAGPDPNDPNAASRTYKVGTLQLLPPSENIFVIKKSGWHQAEFGADNPALDWQWTQKSAVLAFRNPQQGRHLLPASSTPVRTSLATIRSKSPSIQRARRCRPSRQTTVGPSSSGMPITAAQLGDAEMAEVRIDVDRTFVPSRLAAGGKDDRELGLRVYHAFFEAR